ncbi:glycosyltransferase family 8 protein [Pseudaeromonas paramecii]|uniref:Glycosyltransferase family 8 protein n=1 Tax=Pseudaeromonas paramecii TaxID=2138166 RepID=A0ABP8PWN9_9GAMM
MADQIPLFIAFDDNYVPFGGCVIKSALLNKSDKYDFSFYVLHEGLSLTAQQTLTQMVEEHPGAQIHFLDVGDYFAKMELHVHTIYNRATYYRLAIPDLLPDAKRGIYLDSDLIINGDLCELYDWDLQGKSLAAARDVMMYSLVRTSALTNRESGSLPIRRYFSEVLGLPDPEYYYQAGVFVLDLARLRELNRLPQMMELAANQKYWMADQDILNSLFVGDIAILPQRWNLLTGGGEYQHFLAKVDGPLMDEYRSARQQPAIIHYASYTKPWSYADIDYAPLFWQVLRQTPWQHQIYDWLQAGKIKSVAALPYAMSWKTILTAFGERLFPKGAWHRTALIYLQRKLAG